MNTPITDSIFAASYIDPVKAVEKVRQLERDRTRLMWFSERVSKTLLGGLPDEAIAVLASLEIKDDK